MQALEDLLKEAQELNKAKKYSEVIELLSDEVSETYQSADLYAEKAQAFYRLGKTDLCNEVTEKAMLIDENHAKANNYKGNLYADSKEYDKAIEAYNKAIRTDPEYAFPYNGLGNVYYFQFEYDKAINAYNKAIEIGPEFPNAYNGFGTIYLTLKEYDKAIIAYNKAIEIDPEFDSSYYNRGLTYESQSDYSKALADFEKYYELTKGTDDYFTQMAKSKIAELKKIVGSLDYKRISELVVKIKKLLLFQADCVTHYTGLLATKALIFEQSKFRLSEGAFLNDTSEGRELFKFLPDLRKSTSTNETIALPFIQKPFIGSFVSEIKHDDLTLWRMYGKENKDEARGCAITFNRGKLLENLKESLIKDGKTEITVKMDEEFSFYRVAYRKEGEEELFIIPGASAEDQKTLNDYMLDLANKIKKFHSKRRKASDIQNVLELLSSIAYLFKSAEYQYEHELRLVVEGIGFKKIVNSESTQPRVYIELVPICPFINKITLGPKVERADEWAAAFYYSLDQLDYHPEILISHLPFK